MCNMTTLICVCAFPVCRYVLRRILRRGVRYCTEVLNAKPGVFASLVTTVVEILVSVRLGEGGSEGGREGGREGCAGSP